MNILLTGASSFTGYWFARELTAAGHCVTAVLSQKETWYESGGGLRQQRLQLTRALGCRMRYNAPFGSADFMRVIKSGAQWDALCHHAACTRNYKSADFNAAAALAENARNLPATLTALSEKNCRRIVLTGSVFEAGEGGERNAPALSPYGLSKSLTTAAFQFYAPRCGMRLGHFVIPNPFGPFEEPRFTAYLMRTWQAGDIAVVNTPDYLRDNIHASLLAKSYARFVSSLPASPGFTRARPCGYVETQGAFTRRYAREMQKRLNLKCRVSMPKQTVFNEPLKRINSQPPDIKKLGWSEKKAWDDIAAYYRAA